MAKVLIAGAGPAGLAVGILALKNGLEAEIYEKNADPGGLCAQWSRRGYTLPAGPRWLPAAGPGGALRPLLLALDALDPDFAPPLPPTALTLRQGGVVLTLRRNLEQLERELTAISPRDGPEILALTETLGRVGRLPFPAEKPPDLMMAWQRAHLNIRAAAAGRLPPYYRISALEYSRNFHHPAIRALLLNAGPPGGSAAASILALGRLLSPTGCYLPQDGGLVRRLVRRFQTLGGSLRTGCGAERALISGDRVRGLLLRNSKTALGDYIVLACDPWISFDRLLGRRHMGPAFGDWYSSPESRPVFSHFSCFFGLEGDPSPLCETPTCFACRPLSPQAQDPDWLWAQAEAEGAPAGCRLLRCSLPLNEEECGRWLALAQNKERYGVEKHRFAMEIQRRLTEEFPQLTDRLRLLNAVTPASYRRITGAYKGSFWGFQAGPGSRPEISAGQAAGLENCFLAGQWLHPPGGLSAAFSSAQFTVQRICRLERLRFQL